METKREDLALLEKTLTKTTLAQGNDKKQLADDSQEREETQAQCLGSCRGGADQGESVRQRHGRATYIVFSLPRCWQLCISAASKARTARLKTDEAFFAETKDSCKAKADQWSSRARARTEELAAIDKVRPDRCF